MDKIKPLTTKDIEEKILSILSCNIMSTSQLARELGLKRYILTGYLEAMKNQGKLEYHRVGKSNIYTANKGWKK
jgi:predicted transcriptional regulator